MNHRKKCDSDFVRVKDGGTCYWHARINLSQRKVLSLVFNGEA